MAWEMNSSGGWTQSAGSGEGNSDTDKVLIDKGNTADTNAGIKQTTENKTESIKYAEEANFSTDGNYAIKRGGKLLIGDGVASRWQGEWLILETTHTVDVRGYKTEGVLGRIPYIENSGGDKKKASDSGDKKSDSKTGDVKSGDASGGKWEMDSSGAWRKVGA